MSKPIFVLNGPNLNLLGEREPHIYGHESLGDVEARCVARAKVHGMTIVFRQTNREGELIDWVQEARLEASAVVINPAGYGHTSIALHDALKALQIPIIECHISNPAAREAFRHHSYVSSAASAVICGLGVFGYELAMDGACHLLAAK